MDAYKRRHDRVALFHDLMKAGIPVHARTDDWYAEAETWHMSGCQRLTANLPVKVDEQHGLLHHVRPIPQAVALQLCAEICQTNRRHWYTRSGWRCWWCVRCAKDGIPARLAVSPDCTGCDKVTKRYAALLT